MSKENGNIMSYAHQLNMDQAKFKGYYLKNGYQDLIA